MFHRSRFALFLVTISLYGNAVLAEDPPALPSLPPISGSDMMPGLEPGPVLPPAPAPSEPVAPIAAPVPSDTAPPVLPTADNAMPPLPPADNTIAPISAPVADSSAPPAAPSDTGAPPLTASDVNLPPLPGEALPQPAKPAKDAGSVIDSFFSDVKILPTEPAKPAEPTKPDLASIPLPEEPIKPKKTVRKAPPMPAYNYKSQILPPSIYKKQYSSDNRHLPRAVYTEDLADKMAIVIARGDVEDAKALHKFGVSLTALLPSGDTPLTLATRYQKPYVMQWLLSQGVPVNDTDTNGFSALHYAAFGGSSDMVDMLLSYGADPNITDTRGLTPLAYANFRGAQGVESVIRSFGGVM
ncbi:MAG: ankyrin repeat domain-containing protein [Rickettsiales bacterium]